MAEVHEQTQQTVTLSINDLIYTQVKELGKRMDRIETRMDKLETRMDKLNEKIEDTRREFNARMDKQDAKIEKLADKIDALHNEIKSSTGHISIANISTVGIALAVIYSVLK